MKNLILTSGSGYKFYHLQPFLDTLVSTGYQDEVVFFVSDTDDTTLLKLKKYPINVIQFTYDYPYLPNNPNVAEHIPAPLDFVPHPKTIRYILYLAYLKAHENQFENIMVTDVRDVIFQKDPFDFQIGNKIYGYLEDDRQMIKDNYFNANWIKEAFGSKAFGDIGNKPIVCSGITIGNYLLMVDYLEKLTHYIINVVKDKGCKDQGIHNYLIHTNQVKQVELIPDDEGPVSTISSYKDVTDVLLDKTKQVRSKQGQLVNVVHQYDRHWQLLWKYNKRYYVKRRIDFLKQFAWAVRRSGRLKRSHLENLRSIVFSPMWEKYEWD